MKLPRFILLTGARTACEDFARELITRDPQNIGFSNFDDPIRNSIVALFYDSRYTAVNFDQPSTWTQDLPLTDTTVESYYYSHMRHLRLNLGSDILGRIFLNSYIENDWESLWPTTILRDYNHNPDLNPILDRYGDNADYVTIHPERTTVDQFLNHHAKVA